jgi:hypothetical protein
MPSGHRDGTATCASVIDSEWITATDAVEGIATSEATDPSMLMPVRATVAVVWHHVAPRAVQRRTPLAYSGFIDGAFSSSDSSRAHRWFGADRTDG